MIKIGIFFLREENHIARPVKTTSKTTAGIKKYGDEINSVMDLRDYYLSFKVQLFHEFIISL